jgi:hypothetical protein
MIEEGRGMILQQIIISASHLHVEVLDRSKFVTGDRQNDLDVATLTRDEGQSVLYIAV